MFPLESVGNFLPTQRLTPVIQHNHGGARLVSPLPLFFDFEKQNFVEFHSPLDVSLRKINLLTLISVMKTFKSFVICMLVI